MEFMNGWVKISFLVVLATWFATGAAIVSRLQLVFDYSTLPLVSPEYEIIAASSAALLALVVSLMLGIAPPILSILRGEARKGRPPAVISSDGLVLVSMLLAASFPLLLLVLRIAGVGVPAPGWWELLWFAGWTGGAVRCSPWTIPCSRGIAGWWWFGLLSLAVLSSTYWWYHQSISYYADYQLGFNDFGHFTQRISNTANGHGILLESPVLPPFWDHFNPGLLLLVPLWSLVPRVEVIFAVQSFCLAGSAWLVSVIAFARRQSAAAACIWGLAWLVFPSVGQMNLAYTYGWHPITLAIPCLLAAYLMLLLNHHVAAIAFGALAASFEEGVFIAVACFAFSQAIRALWHSRSVANDPATRKSQRRALHRWAIVVLVSLVGFVCVYRFSGLAPFQTGRFSRLGGSVLEIISSPITRPQEFWGLALRPRNLAFSCLVLVPFAIVATRAWLWALLAIAPPWCVLLIWEHMPAQSLAFQYTSCLLPVLFLGVIEQDLGNARLPHPRACGLLAIGWILSICMGQMPWSNDSLIDVKAKTYGIDTAWRREQGSEDERWIGEWIRTLRVSRADPAGILLPEWGRLRVLATGRIAAHCVGTADVETVGQFRQRYDALKSISPELASPILRYDVILLDLRESFQQTPDETLGVLREAEQHGWVIRSKNFDLVLMNRSIHSD